MTTDSRLKSFEKKMEDSIISLNKDLSTIRTGRAHSSMLDLVKVEVYGQSMPINQVATITVTDPQTISIQVWDANNVKFCEKAIDKFNKDNSDNFEIISYYKFKVGEGIEVKKTDFSEEVKSLAK